MHKYFLYRIFVVALFTIGSMMPTYGQDVEVRHFDKKEWKEITDGVDYTLSTSKRVEREGKKELNNEPIKTKRQRNFKSPFSGFSAEGLSGFSKIVLLILAVVGLAIFIRFLVLSREEKVKTNVKLSEANAHEVLEHIEQNLDKANIASYIDQAINNGQYSLAIRLYYLDVVKALSGKNVIRWKKDKTNNDYIAEAKPSPFGNDFEAITRGFERIWYGNMILNQSDFNHIQPGFVKLLNKINEK